MNVCNDLWSIRRYASRLYYAKCIFQSLFHFLFSYTDKPLQYIEVNFFYKIFEGHKPFLWGHRYPCFWTSGDASSGFQSQSGQPFHTLQRCMCYMFHEIHLWCDTSQPLGGQHASCEQALVGLKPGIYCTATASHCKTRQTLYWLSYAGSAIEVKFKYQVFESRSRSKMLKILNFTKSCLKGLGHPTFKNI